ncbi:hypothetical protein E4U42_002723 [Claviceps africana]|uniref:Uncharacterized protein n=1 Tax=Claviceps africana TaxID=83212 RepID=A0A8K0NKY9_9HYPO|nr:hypothetical protein E4U42_002723 [Claviceps africana]
MAPAPHILYNLASSSSVYLLRQKTAPKDFSLHYDLLALTDQSVCTMYRFCSLYFASLLIHLLGIASLGSSFQLVLNLDTPITKSHGSHFQFLTIIGLVLSLSAFLLAAIADISGSTTLFRLKNLISIVATPLELLISSLYWGICVIDASLVVQPGFEIGIWMDLGLHLAPAVFLVLDLILFSPPWTNSAYSMMSLSTAFAFVYWYWIELCFDKNGWLVSHKILEIVDGVFQ